jgi:hypothetical protein
MAASVTHVTPVRVRSPKISGLPTFAYGFGASFRNQLINERHVWAYMLTHKPLGPLEPLLKEFFLLFVSSRWVEIILHVA